MATCPNKNLQSWKDLVSSKGENLAYYLWDKYKGTVPISEYKPGFEKFQVPSAEGIVASEKTIRDLAARISDRIGIPYKIISDRTQEFKGKIENNTAIVNLAYATLDTPIHEILGHPIIRAIRNRKQINDKKIQEIQNMIDYPLKREDGYSFYDLGYEINTNNLEEYKKELNKIIQSLKSEQSAIPNLYQNLLKELEYGKGKEVLDRIKKDYDFKNPYRIIKDTWGTEGYEVVKNESEVQLGGKFFTTLQEAEDFIKQNNVSYTLEEQQEEAIVELLGMMTAEKLDAVKDGKLISLLKRLLKEMKQFVRSLLRQREVEIDKLPDNMTLGDIADLLAYSNSKLILPGNEVVYTTPDNQQFKTYAEASRHISDLAKSVKDVDLSNINIRTEEETYSYYYMDRWFNTLEEAEQYKKYLNIDTLDTIEKKKTHTSIKEFLVKNKEYEQSKEIIEEWKKVNNIQYNPEEIYSRGQEFTSVVGAYSNFDVNLMMQNLLQHIEDNEKAGGEFTISAFTKPIDRKIGHLEGGGGKIKFKIYPQSKDIKWAANTDVYSGSVWDASEKVSKDKKSELLGVSYTKYPSLSAINSVQPNLANIVDDLAHHHNELGINLTGNNFRLEYDKDVPYSTKKIIDSINSILDEKYGKLVKPKIEKGKKETILIDNPLPENERSGVIHYDSDRNGGYFLDTIYGYERKGYALGDRIGSWKVQQILKIVYPNLNVTIQPITNKVLVDGKDIVTYKGLKFETSDKIEKEVLGIQPTQTNETLKESIESVKDKVTNEYKLTLEPITKEQYDNAVKESFAKSNDVIGDWTEDGEIYYVDVTDTLRYRKDSTGYYAEKADKISKEYTDQALINTKIAKLKEVAKKYPRSLIRSEVKPIFGAFVGETFIPFDKDELPFQKIPGLTEKAEKVAKPKKDIIFTPFNDLENLPKGKPC